MALYPLFLAATAVAICKMSGEKRDRAVSVTFFFFQLKMALYFISGMLDSISRQYLADKSPELLSSVQEASTFVSVLNDQFIYICYYHYVFEFYMVYIFIKSRDKKQA